MGLHDLVCIVSPPLSEEYFLHSQLVGVAVRGAGDGDVWFKGREMDAMTLEGVPNTSHTLGSASSCRLPSRMRNSAGIWH